VRGKKSEEEYKHILREQIYPEFEAIKSKIKNEKLLEPKAVYGYFPLPVRWE
jgi:5-methyltetrahydrofolate--homocysteine methyltransferase